MKKVLIVDDDPLITRLYAWHFRAAGFEVAVANSGREGLAAVSSFLPDAVLLDLDMPDLDGVHWLEEVRKDPRFARLPITAFTAATYGWQFWAASNAGVSFIFKSGAVPREVVRSIGAALAAAAPPVVSAGPSAPRSRDTP
ncbi:MAG TPA: response regulator [Verrucomicrobiae bacterium]|nr:response regulator [Verrucomicrobiae bacterium]